MSATTDQLTSLLADVRRVVGSDSVQQKRQKLAELQDRMNASGFWDDPKAAGEASQAAAEIQREVDEWLLLEREVGDAADLAAHADGEGDQHVLAELGTQAEQLLARFRKLELGLLLNGRYDDHGGVVSIYAGAGGVDAQDWAEMLLRMYTRYAERRGWKVAIAEQSRGTEAGIKSVTIEVEGRNAYGYLQGENGVHRLIRLSPYDADGARHTSFAMVEVLPIVEAKELDIRDEDLKVETKTASGHGGQSVNTTYSAIRITHIPTGITVSCQDERSQQQNRERAMRILRGKLERYHAAQAEEERQALRGERTEAAWGNHIRSYVLHPYRQVREHRSEYEESDPDAVLNGDLDGFIEHYLRKKASV